MGTYIKKAVKTALPACLGASIGTTIVKLFRYPILLSSLSGIGDLLFNFIYTFIVTTIIVTVCFWVWFRIKRK